MKETTEKNTNTAEVIAIEKPYTFRTLSSTDMFLMLKLLNKIGIKELKDNDNMKSLLFMFMGGTVKGKVDVNRLGVDIFFELAAIITEYIPKCEQELYDLLSATSNLTVDDIRGQNPATTFEMIVDFVQKEEFVDFFRAVSKLFK